MHAHVTRIVLVVVVALLLVPTPAPANHGYDQPVTLHSGTAQGAFWTAYKVHTDGAGIATHFTVDTPSLPSGLGALIIDGAGKVYFGLVGAVIPGANGAYVDVNVVPGVPVHYDLLEPSPDYPFWMVAMNMNGYGTPNPYVGELTFVWWTSGGTNKGIRYDLQAEPGVTMIDGRECLTGALCTYGTGWETGTDTFVYTSEDFVGSANVKAGNGQAAARGNVETMRSVVVDNRLMAGFVGYGTHADVLTATTPATTIDCTLNCFPGMNDTTGPQGPGNYTFTVSAGAGGGPALTTFGEVVLNGADVVLPAEAP